MDTIIHPFQRLQVELAEIIARTPPGERLPSEPALAKQLGVSRATLREAMRAFEGQGLIRRRQGIGTFVVSHVQVIETGLDVLQSIESLAEKINLKVYMGDVKIVGLEADAILAENLNVEKGAPLVKVERVITTEHRPVAYLIDILPENILSPAELEQGFTGSVLDFLLKRGDLNLMNSYTEINAASASSEIARSLEIQRGDPLLLFEAYLYDDGGRVVDYSHSYFLPGYFRFHLVRRVANRPNVNHLG